MSNTELILYLLLAIIACAAILFAFRKPGRGRVKAGNAILLKGLEEECWQAYMALERFKAYKARCRRAVIGDFGISVANKRLAAILEGGQSAEYKAQRIVGRVCDLIINMATANGMLGEGNVIAMPSDKAELMSRNAFLMNMAVSDNGAEGKYNAVIRHLRSELAKEQQEQKFVVALEGLVPLLETITFIVNNEGVLRDEEIVERANEYYLKSSKILEGYE